MKIRTEEASPEEVKIGHWKISGAYGIVASPEDRSLVLEPRLAKLIYILGENADQIVSRDFLVKSIWTDTIVNDESLTRAIADLRKRLRENFDSVIKIETIPKRGYRMSLPPGRKKNAFARKVSSSRRFAMLGVAALFLTFLWYVGVLKIVVV